MRAGWKKLADMRKVIGEPMRGEVYDCFTRLDSVKDGMIEKGYFRIFIEYWVGNLGATAAYDNTKKKWFRSRGGHDYEETDLRAPDRHML